MDDPWITVNFIPVTVPYFLHMLDGPTGTRTERVVGWLVQHRHGEATPRTDARSRVIAGTFEPSTGEVDPVNCDFPSFVGVYPEGKAPHCDEVERGRESWFEQLRRDAAKSYRKVDEVLLDLRVVVMQDLADPVVVGALHF